MWDRSQFAKAHPEITYESAGFPYAQYAQKMKIAMAAGEADPDIIFVHSRWNRDFVGTDLLLDITNQVDRSAFGEAQLKGVSYQGKIWGIPYEVSTLVNYYRPDALEKSGLRYPDTLEQYFEAAQRVRGAGKWLSMLSRAADNSNIYLELVVSLGGDLFDSTGQKLILDTPEGKGIEAAEILLKLASVSRDLDSQSPEGFTAMKKGEVVGNFHQYSWIHRMKDAIVQGDEPFGKFRVGPIPARSGPGTTRNVTYGPLVIFVSKSSDNKAAAVEVAKFFSHSVEGITALANEFLVLGAYTPGLLNLETAGLAWPIFGGQKVQWFLAQNIMSKDLGMMNPSKYVGEAQNIVADHITRMLTGQFTAEQAVREASKKIREAIR